jgi:hypothetical protein
VLESRNGQGELGHRMEVIGAVVDQLFHKLGDIGSGSPVGGQAANLSLGGDLARQKKPKETLKL